MKKKKEKKAKKVAIRDLKPKKAARVKGGAIGRIEVRYPPITP
jgi:hypothetical protein